MEATPVECLEENENILAAEIYLTGDPLHAPALSDKGYIVPRLS